MASPADRTAAPAGEPSRPAAWQDLHFPSAEEWVRISDAYPHTLGQDFYQLEPWIRLGWPSRELWDIMARTADREVAEAERLKGHKVRVPEPYPEAAWPWDRVLAVYPMRQGIADEMQDVYRVLRFWPDCFGMPMVDVTLQFTEGITVNQLTYHPGALRVPAPVGTLLRSMDAAARQAFLDQFIPKKHQTRFIDMETGRTGVWHGEVTGGVSA